MARDVSPRVDGVALAGAPVGLRCGTHIGCWGSAAPPRTGPHHPRITFQRPQGLLPICPFRGLSDGDVIERLAPRATVEQRARNVHHLRAAAPRIQNGRTAAGAERARVAGLGVREAGEPLRALGHANAALPASNIRRIGRAVRAPRRGRMIVPRPESGNGDLDLDLAAQAPAGGNAGLRLY
jgi:hypothetical protein